MNQDNKNSPTKFTFSDEFMKENKDIVSSFVEMVEHWHDLEELKTLNNMMTTLFNKEIEGFERLRLLRSLPPKED